MHDLRLAFRSLVRSPGYALVIVITLALGIGANTAIFSFFSGILMRPLPYADPERVVLFKKDARDFSEPMGVEIGMLAADFRDLRSEVRSLESIAAYTLDSATVTGRGTPDLSVGAVVTPNYFSMLGSRAALGRTFTDADVTEGSGRPAVLAHRYWQSRFGGDPAIIGQTVTLNRVPFVVVGVMSPEFEFPREAQFWVTPADDVPENTIGVPRTDFGGRGNHLRTILGRLRAGASREQAELELAALVERLPNPNQVKREVHLVTMSNQSVGNVRPALTVLLACAGLVLLIACLNVANLTLSRATHRQREIHIRLALGSGRWRVARQLLVEALVLAVLGGGAGVLLSVVALDALVRVAPDDIPRLATVAVDARVLGFALVLTVVTGVACGLGPVVGAARTDLSTAIKSGGERGGTAGSGRRLRAGLVAGEVAISLVLLIGAGLLLRSLAKMQAVAWGFDPTHVVSARVAFMDERYATQDRQRQFYRALHDRLEEIVGVESVGSSLDRIGQTWVHLPFQPEGFTFATPSDLPQAAYHLISPDYFRTLGIALLHGRAFRVTDDENSPRVAIIDDTLARRFFPDRSAVGQRVGLPSPQGTRWVEIVGVVSSVKSDGPTAEARPDVYIPLLQVPVNNFFVHLRTHLDVATAGAALQRAVQAVDASVPVTDLASMEQVIARPANARRFPLGLIAAFAGLALVLAGVGIYAVTAYGVAQRKREMGVRMALGASPEGVVGLVVKQGFRPIFIGLVGGMTAALLTARAMRGLLFGVEPIDAPTFFFVPLIIALLATVACWLPARTATKIDPIIALRAE
jgi:predicted permease